MQINCPRCKKLTEYDKNPFRPFCSERCKMIDLGLWATEKYSVPVEESSKDEEQHEFEAGLNKDENEE